MSEAERRLAELFAADQPPATDSAFTFVVLERIERRRMWLKILNRVPFFIAAAALLWLLAPAIDSLVQSILALVSAPTFAVTAMLLLTVFVVLTSGRLRAVWRL